MNSRVLPTHPCDKGCTPNPSGFGAVLRWTRVAPPNPSRFGAAPKWTRMGPPNPSRFGAANQMDKDGTPPNPSHLQQPSNGQGLHPPTLRDLERPPKWTRMGHPKPFTIWSGSQMDKDWTPTPHDLERPPKWTRIGRPQPFNDLERFPNGQGLDPPNSSRFGVVLKWTRIGPTKS